MKLLHITESVSLDLGPRAEEIKEKVLQVIESDKHIIVPKIEAIHATITRNNVFYPAARLKGNPEFREKGSIKVRPTGVHSWTAPFCKPMLINHDIDVDPLGRIQKAEYKPKLSNGLPGIICYPTITDPIAMEKVLDGRYATVSIGADTDAAICSVCGTNRLEEACEHQRGRTYEGKLCFWSAGNLWFAELSYVNAPADEDAHTLEVLQESANFTQLGLLIQDLKENKLYDLSNDKVFAMTNNGLVQIPQEEFIKEYYYVPFNIKVEECAEEDLSESATEQQNESSACEDGETIGNNPTKGGHTLSDQNHEEVLETQDETVVEEQVENIEVQEEVTETPAEDLEEQAIESNVEQELSEAHAQIESLTTQNEQVMNYARQLASLLGIVTEENTESAGNGSALQEELTQKDAEITRLRNENQELLEKVIELKASSTNSVVEKIADLKVSLGDITEEDRATEIEKLSSRSEESLLDTLSDLEQRNPKTQVIVEHIENPALVDNSEDGVIDVTDNQQPKSTKEKLEIRPDQALYGLLTGKKKR